MHKKRTYLSSCKSCGGSAYIVRLGRGGMAKCSQCSMRAEDRDSLSKAVSDWNAVAPFVEDVPVQDEQTPEPTSPPKPKRKRKAQKGDNEGMVDSEETITEAPQDDPFPSSPPWTE